jgi:YggT family protein
MLILRILSSWFPLPRNPIVVAVWNFLYEITEPVLGIFRRLLPPAMVGAVGIDLSPIIALFVLQFAYGYAIRPLLITLLGF